MKINATICRHGDSLLVLKLTASVILAARGSPASLHQICVGRWKLCLATFAGSTADRLCL